MEKQFQLYAAPLQGLTEPAWRNAHWQTIGGVDAYFTPFVRWEKGSIRNKDRRDVAPSSNSVHRLIPQVLAAEAGEFRQLVDWLQKLGYGEVDLNMGCPFPLLVRKGRGAGILSHPDRDETRYLLLSPCEPTRGRDSPCSNQPLHSPASATSPPTDGIRRPQQPIPAESADGHCWTTGPHHAGPCYEYSPSPTARKE